MSYLMPTRYAHLKKEFPCFMIHPQDYKITVNVSPFYIWESKDLEEY